MAKISKRAKKQIINITVVVVLIAVTLLVVFLSQDINIHDIGRFLASCNPWYILAAFACMLGYIIFEAIGLHIIARKFGHKSKFRSSIAYSTSDLYYSAITPSASGGQPASAFYMVRDGMSGGTAGFTVLFNLVSYTCATIVIGLFALIARPSFFPLIGNWFAKLLIILGFVIQFLLLAFLLLCLFRSRIILGLGNWGVRVLTKIKIIKKPDKWFAKVENVVTKYRSCRGVLKEHPILFFVALTLNTLQRASQTLIPCFVCYAADPTLGFLDMFCMQAYVLIGYNSIPLPGGTGAYEYLYPNVFGVCSIDMTFILSAMMVSRAISYYACMIVCGVYTLIYHLAGGRKSKVVEDTDKTAVDFDLAEAVKQGISEGKASPDQTEKPEEPLATDENAPELATDTEPIETVAPDEANAPPPDEPNEVDEPPTDESEATDTGDTE
ncbi:MAG: flippase-like domain-containing protein [Clostridiales bacterium]|nr:flippase-like domain-containing protein [Clostridiales bacterium]